MLEGCQKYMKELLRTNDAVLLSWVTALLAGEGIETHVFDNHASILDGSIGAVPRRLMVADEDLAPARAVLKDAEVEKHDILFPEDAFGGRK